jgi:hypothetical protein
MDTRAESRGADARPLEGADQAPFPLLAELALALPWKMVHATRALLRPAGIRPGRDGINMASMSGAWLIQYADTCGKQGDPL